MTPYAIYTKGHIRGNGASQVFLMDILLCFLVFFLLDGKKERCFYNLSVISCGILIMAVKLKALPVFTAIFRINEYFLPSLIITIPLAINKNKKFSKILSFLSVFAFLGIYVLSIYQNGVGNELVPYRPELENVTSQKITLLVPPSSGPSHPRTVFFINDPELNENLPLKNYETVDVKITEKKYMFLYKAYKNLPLCLSGPMKYNRVIRSKLFDNTNIVWKLMKKDRMFPYLETLNKYQKFNHFPMTWQLSRKDNLYNNFINMKNKFPNDF